MSINVGGDPFIEAIAAGRYDDQLDALRNTLKERHRTIRGIRRSAVLNSVAEGSLVRVIGPTKPAVPAGTVLRVARKYRTTLECEYSPDNQADGGDSWARLYRGMIYVDAAAVEIVPVFEPEEEVA